MYRYFPAGILCLFIVTGFSAQVSAGVVIGGTRFVYGEKQNGILITVNNNSNISYLISAHIENGGNWDGSEATVSNSSKFFVTPPLFTLGPERENILRIIRADGNMPNDKESLFTLDIASIPSGKATSNSVQIAVRSKLKLFYRPSKLKGNPADAYKQLLWKREGKSLVVNNPSPYYVTLFQLNINGESIDNAGMVPPFGSRKINGCNSGGNCQLRWQTINDYGRIMPAVTLAINGPNQVSVISKEQK